MSQRSEPAAGNIYDLGYRRYEGVRLGRHHAITSLYFFSLRGAFGLGRRTSSKIVPVALVIIALIPALIQLGIAAIVSSQDITVIKLENYFTFVEITAALFCAAVAPEVIGRDQRTRTLPLYFSRALRRSDYTLAKLAAMTTALLFLTLLPEVILLIGHGFASTDQAQFWKDNWGDVPRVIAAGLIAAATMASLSLLIAAQTARRAYATVACVAVYLIPLPIAAIFTNDIGGLAGRLVIFLSPINLLEGATFWVFRAAPDSGSILESANFRGWTYGLAALIATALSTALLLRRYASIST